MATKRATEKIPLMRLTGPSQVACCYKRREKKEWQKMKRMKKEKKGGKAGEGERERGREGKEIELCLEMHAATSGFGLKIRDVFDASMA